MSERILDRYQPLFEAGSGGFATVVVAYDTHLRREVAIKCIPLDDAQTQALSAAAVREAAGQASGTKGERARSGTGDGDPFDDRWRTASGADFNPDDLPPWEDPADYGLGRQRTDDDFAPLNTGFVADADDDAFDSAPAAGGSDESFPLPARALEEGRTISMMEETAAASATPGLEEARMAAMLNDSSIVSIYDFEVQDGMAYLIMEYVEGMSVADLLKQYPDEINPDIVAAIFKAVAHALQVAHANHVLHLDIKPDNVLINQKGQVKVVDFGLARLADEGGFGVASAGTIGYMPIEQMRREELDERCDEWALASLTYEVIAQNNVFIARDLASAEDAIFGAELVLPSLCMDGLDEEIDDILFCALAPYRDERYDTVKESAKNLQPCLGSPRQGTKDLAQLVGHWMADDDADEDDGPFEEEPHEPREPFDPFTPRLMQVWTRVSAAVGAALVGYVSFGNLPGLNGWGDPACWGLLAALVALTAVLPHAGAAVGFASLGVMLFVNEAPLPGAAVIAAGICWWALIGRTSNRQGDVALAPAVLGAISCAPLTPLLAGWLLRPVQAMAATAAGGVLAFALGGLGTKSLLGWDPMSYDTLRIWTDLNANFAEFVQDPAQWICFASWILAAGAMSVLCNSERRGLVYAGIGAAEAVLVVGLCLGSFAERGGAGVAPDPLFVVSTVSSGLLMALLALKGCPPREDYPEDDPEPWDDEE